MVSVPTGIAVEIPAGYEGQVRARSGLAAKFGIGLTNGVGTIDADYRGEIAALLVNQSSQCFTINPGDRVCQLVFSPVIRAELIISEGLGYSARGCCGFGSTGGSDALDSAEPEPSGVEL